MTASSWCRKERPGRESEGQKTEGKALSGMITEETGVEFLRGERGEEPGPDWTGAGRGWSRTEEARVKKAKSLTRSSQGH